MTGFEWFLLVVVVIVVPLVVAVAVTLWTLEMARQRKRQNRPATDPSAGPVKRKATRAVTTDAGDAPVGSADAVPAGDALSESAIVPPSPETPTEESEPSSPSPSPSR